MQLHVDAEKLSLLVQPQEFLVEVDCEDQVISEVQTDSPHMGVLGGEEETLFK